MRCGRTGSTSASCSGVKSVKSVDGVLGPPQCEAGYSDRQACPSQSKGSCPSPANSLHSSSCRKLEALPEQDRLEQDYHDYLQAPLQPLQVGPSPCSSSLTQTTSTDRTSPLPFRPPSLPPHPPLPVRAASSPPPHYEHPSPPYQDNLESSTYEVFERDVTKYTQYEEAVYRALMDR